MKSFLLLVVFTTLHFFGNAQNSFHLSEEESLEVIKSAEFQEFGRLQNEFIDKIQVSIEKGTSMDAIKKAALQNNEPLFYSLVFGSVKSGSEFAVRLQNAKKNLIEKNPYYEKNKEVFTCTTCKTTLEEDVEYFFSHFDSFAANQPLFGYGLSERSIGNEAGPICGSYWNQLKVALCAGGCSILTGGVATIICGWACWCQFCKDNSALAAQICK